MQKNLLDDFIQQNTIFIYDYINNEILHGVGKINFTYFTKIIQSLDKQEVDKNILPYFLFTLFSDTGKMDYTALRVDTIDLNLLDKEALVYYNYAQFILDDNSLLIQLIQTKTGGMPIKENIIKFTKKIPIKNLGLEQYILKNKDL